MREIIFEDEYIQVIFDPRSSQTDLITFSYAAYPANGRDYWAYGIAAKLDMNGIGFVAKYPNWFPSASMNDSLPIVLSKLSGERIVYGHSMGAFAALKYSRRLGADVTIAMSPQFTIDPNIIASRYAKFYIERLHRNFVVEESDIGGQCYVVFDPHQEEDRRHFSHLENYSKITPIHCNFVGHDTVFAVSRTESARALFRMARENDPIGLFQLFRERKKKEAVSLRAIALSALERGRIAHGSAIAELAIGSGLTEAHVKELRTAIADSGHKATGSGRPAPK